MIKSIKKNDIRTTPFTAAKTWNPQNKRPKDLILWQSGSISGSLSLTFKEFNDGTVPPYTYISSAIHLQQQEDDFVKFREGVNLTGSISPTGSFYFDPVLSEKNLDGTYKTVLYATTKHLFYKESQDPTKIFGLESLDSSKVNRNLPDKISTFNIPQNKFGEKVIPNTVEITHEIQGNVYKVVDDGNSNLVISDKTFVNNQDVNVDKIPANIYLNGLDTEIYDYDGNPYSITAITKPSNLDYTVTYNGSSTPPTNAGTYTVVATINDNFYFGSTKGTLIIQKASRAITLSNLNQTYDGTPKEITATTATLNLNKIITYNGSTTPPTNAGVYTVVVTINELNYQGTKTGTLTITGKTPDVLSNCPTKTYGDPDFDIPVNSNSNGSISYTINSGPAVIKNGKIRITNVGTIDVTVNQAASGNYIASSINCSITVNQKPLTVTGITANNKSYDGNSNATLNTTNKQLVGVVTYPNGSSDIVTLGGTVVGTFNDSSVGEGKTVTISGLTISGTDSSKYTLVQPTAIASIKSNTGSGTITMSDKLVTYNGSEQVMPISVNDSDIPIKITYTDRNNNILKVQRLYSNILSDLKPGKYPVDSGKYTVTAELDAAIATSKIYTVSKVSSTLEIKPIQASISFGPNIFYYDGSPKQIQILSKTPNFNPVITYNGSSTPPTNVGNYDVKIQSFDSNVFYEKTIKLVIKNIPVNNCGSIIVNETINQQYQKNIIDLTSAIGKVNFNYSVGKGASQFKIEYPLNSGTIVYDSLLRSLDIPVGTSVVDYISKNTIKVNGIQNPDNNSPISFVKDKTGINSDNGYNNDKCLITVYSPTDNNSWNYSVSCVNVEPPVVQPLPGIKDIYIPSVDVFVSYPAYSNAGSGIHLGLLKAELETKVNYGLLSPYEFGGIMNIISYNSRSNFNFGKDYVLVDIFTNIKVIVTYNSDSKSATINLKYKRLGDSLDNMIGRGPLVVDCHWFKYKGTKVSFDVNDAKTQLINQINGDEFKDTFLSATSTITNGEKQRSLLKDFVNRAITNTSIDNVRFEFLSTSLGIYIYTNPITKLPFNTFLDQLGGGLSDAEGILNDGLIYINPSQQVVEIVYPAICQPINFGKST